MPLCTGYKELRVRCHYVLVIKNSESVRCHYVLVIKNSESVRCHYVLVIKNSGQLDAISTGYKELRVN